ncbi:hypothetical protein, partial [Klebsiella quasivariicola]|uniref:hypothetical protein n=1 Tax=Klebsiella quasivariicola TaxID=2026240 RepID=UPI002B052E3A
FGLAENTYDLFVGKTLLHGDVLMWLMKTLLTSRCINQRGAGQLHLTNTELKYVCCVALKQSPVKYSLNDAKPVKFFVCHSHQHKIAVLC